MVLFGLFEINEIRIKKVFNNLIRCFRFFRCFRLFLLVACFTGGAPGIQGMIQSPQGCPSSCINCAAPVREERVLRLYPGFYCFKALGISGLHAQSISQLTGSESSGAPASIKARASQYDSVWLFHGEIRFQSSPSLFRFLRRFSFHEPIPEFHRVRRHP